MKTIFSALLALTVLSGIVSSASAFDAKGDVTSLLAELSFDAAKARLTREAPSWFHPGRSATMRLGPTTVLAHFGELHPDVLALLGLEGAVAAFEVFLAALPAERRRNPRRPALRAEALLPVRRDFAFVLDSDVPAGDVVRAALGADKTWIAGVSVFDVFEGANLGAGKKSLALEVTLQPTEKTLTDAEIDAIAARIIAAVGRATGGEIRS